MNPDKTFILNDTCLSYDHSKRINNWKIPLNGATITYEGTYELEVNKASIEIGRNTE